MRDFENLSFLPYLYFTSERTKNNKYCPATLLPAQALAHTDPKILHIPSERDQPNSDLCHYSAHPKLAKLQNYKEFSHFSNLRTYLLPPHHLLLQHSHHHHLHPLQKLWNIFKIAVYWSFAYVLILSRNPENPTDSVQSSHSTLTFFVSGRLYKDRQPNRL